MLKKLEFASIGSACQIGNTVIYNAKFNLIFLPIAYLKKKISWFKILTSTDLSPAWCHMSSTKLLRLFQPRVALEGRAIIPIAYKPTKT